MKQNILSLENGQVTFRYKESKSKQYQTITESAVDFLWRVLQHVLPKGFRRARNYGFMHGNAKATLKRLQLILKVILKVAPVRSKKACIVRNVRERWTCIYCASVRVLSSTARRSKTGT